MSDQNKPGDYARARQYADLHLLSEDERIDVMADHVRRGGRPCLVVVDDIADKAERYIRKFRARHPDIAILDEVPKIGPTAGARSFRIGPQ